VSMLSPQVARAGWSQLARRTQITPAVGADDFLRVIGGAVIHH
jgi:hypothetical protein